MIPRMLMAAVACIPMLAWQNSREAISTESRLVLVNATVLDEHNRIRTDLQPQDFHLYEDGRPVSVHSVSLEDVPLSTVILLDVSASMKDTIGFERDALDRFLAGTREGDEFCLVLFRESVGPGCEFQSDVDELRAKASGAVPGGDTGVIDALMFGLDKVKDASNPRRTILVLSDAADTKSRYKWSDARRRALESAAIVYAVSPREHDQSGLVSAPELHRIVEDTGGRFLAGRQRHDVMAGIDRLDIRFQYIIAYAPAERPESGGFHSIRLQLTGAARRRQRAYWRRGYFVAPRPRRDDRGQP